MVNIKPATKHGLDRKFKPWRRGKSEKSNKRSSLKQQLRGIERLLQKIPEEESERREELQIKSRALKLEIDDKQKVIQEKKHAEKAHGQRFLDRQRLTRMEKQVKKSAAADMEEQLVKIALDQVYVAHHPTDVKYTPLFRKGQRVIDTSRQLYRRAVTRRRILKSLTTERQNCTWISKEQYQRLPTSEWNIQDEEELFGGSITRKGMKEVKKKLRETTEDSRFGLAPGQKTILELAEQMDAELEGQGAETEDEDLDINTMAEVSNEDRKSKSGDDDGSEDSSSSSDSEDSEELDPAVKRSPAQIPASTLEEKKVDSGAPVFGDSSSSSSDSDDSSSSSDDDGVAVEKALAARGMDEKSSPSSSDSSSGSESDKDEKVDQGDDFLMDAKEDDDGNVFSMTLKQIPALGEVRGDKSKGWDTQKLRPGQFKKRRVRR